MPDLRPHLASRLLPAACVGLVIAATLALSAWSAHSVRAADEAQANKARDAAAALVRGNFEQAIALYGQALDDKTLPNDRRATIHNDRGVAYARRGQHREAIEDFNRAIQLYPEFAAVYNNRGNVLLGLDATREAIKDFDRALALAPGYAAAFSNRAGAYIKLGQADKALADYGRAVELTPTSPAALNGRGRAHLLAFRPHAAIRDFTRAVTADARFGPAYRSRAEAKLSVERYEEAIEDFSRAIAFEPRNAELYLLRGHAYLESNNVASALKDYGTATEIAPQQSKYFAARGLAHAKAEAFEDALNDLGRAIELDPRAALAYAYRALTFRLQQEVDLASREAERAIKLDANCAEAYWARGEVNLALTRTEAAAADFRKAIEIGMPLRDPQRALTRMGLTTGDAPVEVSGAGLEGWRVFQQGRQYVATNAEYPRLRVNLEMTSPGSPRILEWQVKQAPFEGIGTLRFFAGTIDGPRGAEELEHTAVVDLQAGSVVSVQVHRQGSRMARWTWEDGRVIVASADGIPDELRLRQSKPKDVPVAVRRYADPGVPKKGPSFFDFLFKFKF